VTGEIDPKFRLTVDESELQGVWQQLRELETGLEPQAFDINELYEPGDEVAIAAAGESFKVVLKNTANRLASMKILIYRLAALASIPETERFRNTLYLASQEQFQAEHGDLVTGLVRVQQSTREAMRKCRSPLCAISIAEVQRQLLGLGERLNRGLTVQDLQDLDIQFEIKKNFLALGLLRHTLEETLNELAPPNEKHSLVQSIAAAALTPLITALRNVGTIDFGKMIVTFLKTGVVSRQSLFAEPVKVDTRAESNRLDALANIMIRATTSKKSPEEIEALLRQEDRDAREKGRAGRFHALSCSLEDLFWFDAFDRHAVVAGTADLSCRGLDAQDRSLYRVSLRTAGPGLGIQVGEKLILVLTSLRDIVPEGQDYYGWNATAVPGISPRAGHWIGNFGVTQFALVGGSAGIGATLGVSRMSIARVYVAD